MRRALVVIVYGIGGLVVAIALTLGAYAMAGSDIARPASITGRPVPAAKASLSPTPSEGRADHRNDDANASPSPSVDDHGGGSNSGSVSGTGSSSGSGSSDGSDDGRSDTGTESHASGEDD